MVFLSSKHSVNSQIADQTVACNRRLLYTFIVCIYKQKANSHGMFSIYVLVHMWKTYRLK